MVGGMLWTWPGNIQVRTTFYYYYHYYYYYCYYKLSVFVCRGRRYALQEFYRIIIIIIITTSIAFYIFSCHSQSERFVQVFCR